MRSVDGWLRPMDIFRKLSPLQRVALIDYITHGPWEIFTVYRLHHISSGHAHRMRTENILLYLYYYFSHVWHFIVDQTNTLNLNPMNWIIHNSIFSSLWIFCMVAIVRVCKMFFFWLLLVCVCLVAVNEIWQQFCPYNMWHLPSVISFHSKMMMYLKCYHRVC